MKVGVAKEGFFKEVKVDLSHNGHIVQKVSQGRQFQSVCRPGETICVSGCLELAVSWSIKIPVSSLANFFI